jgi:hypothetical protein
VGNVRTPPPVTIIRPGRVACMVNGATEHRRFRHLISRLGSVKMWCQWFRLSASSWQKGVTLVGYVEGRNDMMSRVLKLLPAVEVS